MNTGLLIGFLVFVFLLLVASVMFLFYINRWLCFDKLPRVLCLEENYEELTSITPSIGDYNTDLLKKDDLVSNHGLDMDNDDKGTIAGEDFGNQEETSCKNKENKSDYYDGKIAKFGQVDISFKFDMMKNTLRINIEGVTNLPKDEGPSEYQLYVKIFNSSGRSLKKWHSAMFKPLKSFEPQIIEYTEMSSSNVSQTAVRLRLYGCERKRRDKLVSESTIGLEMGFLLREDKFNVKLEQRQKVKLKANAPEDDTIDSLTEAQKNIKVQTIPKVCDHMELLVGLNYNHITGRITIEIVKGSALKNPLSKHEEKFPHPFVKITLCDKNGDEIAKSKTSVRETQVNPLFKETFIFQVPLYQLEEVTIILGVYHKKSANRKEIIGWSAVGVNCSSDNEKDHWKNMSSNKGETFYQWHLLQPSSKTRHGLPGAD